MTSLIKQHNNRKEFKKLGLRATPARLVVMKFLEETKKPVDIKTVIDFLNKKSIKTNPATVFRIMNTFTTKGITIRVQFQEGKARYELSNKGDHHHLICENCEKIEDILECAIPTLEKDIKEKNRFLVKRHSLEFFGLCSNCQK